jgi:pimeloyl-ACP methyl ester carboxylesterase
MRKKLSYLVVAAAIGLSGWAITLAKASPKKTPTIVLVHGAFAESSSWNGVIADLTADGYTVVAAANPLRSVKGDAAAVSAVIKSIDGPVILVGHSYGGAVITIAANGNDNVAALVFVDGLALDAGEAAADIGARFPNTLGQALAPPVVQADGAKDLYILASKFRDQFAADIPEAEAALMEATQRPIDAAAFSEPSGPPAWKRLPSWFIYGSLDKNITPAASAFMAQRAGAKKAVEVPGASHVVMVSHPREVTALIEEAATIE